MSRTSANFRAGVACRHSSINTRSASGLVSSANVRMGAIYFTRGDFGKSPGTSNCDSNVVTHSLHKVLQMSWESLKMGNVNP